MNIINISNDTCDLALVNQTYRPNQPTKHNLPIVPTQTIQPTQPTLHTLHTLLSQTLQPTEPTLHTLPTLLTKTLQPTFPTHGVSSNEMSTFIRAD